MAGAGRYLYGIAEGEIPVRLGKIGIDGSEVYAIPFKGLCAIVHACQATPYRSNDPQLVENWVIAHQRALDEAKKRFNTVLPFSFDAILQSRDDSADPDQAVKKWLNEDYDHLRALIEKIRGKDEYAVQVSYEPGKVAKLVSASNDEISQLRRELATKSEGTAYLYRHKLEKLVKTRIKELTDEWLTDFYTRIKDYCDDIIVEKSRKSPNMVMLLNLSCLVAIERVDSLSAELDKINSMDGFSVHFSGPWPPYSFVAKPDATVTEVSR